MKRKTSIRFFMGHPVRALWDAPSSCYLYAAVDLIEAFTPSRNPRIYWNAFKRRHPESFPLVKQGKLTARDGKQYDYDLIDYEAARKLASLLPNKGSEERIAWLSGGMDSLDERSKKRAYLLWESNLKDSFEIGTAEGLKQIHAYLFEGLYPGAGKLRTKNISKGGFLFARCDFLPQILSKIDAMPSNDFDEIISKYIEMNIAHPFMDGNGRATRIWLDLLLKDSLSRVIDWSLINKEDYLEAMTKSPLDEKPIRELLRKALTEKVDDREVFLKGIDYSYYYEEA